MREIVGQRVVVRALATLTVACGLASIAAESAFAKLELVPRPAWEPNGNVLSIARVGDTVLLGGEFDYVGPHTGSAAALVKSSGRPDPLFPKVEGGVVRAIEPDGSGGVYLGGSFRSVGGLLRYGLAHVLADGRVDPDFAPLVSADPEPLGSPHRWTVNALALDGGRLYVGGEFRYVSGTERIGLAAVATGSGAVLPWNPGHTGSVWDIETSASAVYVASNGGYHADGTFVPGRGVAELDPVTARPSSWAPDPPLNGAEALAIVGSTLYVGGNLIGPQPTTRVYSLAAFDTVSHEPLTWSPPVLEGSVRQLLVYGSTLYVRGDFNEPRSGLAAVNRTTGELLPFDPGSGRGVSALALDGAALVAARSSMGPSGVWSFEIERLDPATGAASGSATTTEDRVHALAPVGARIVAGGEFRSVAGARRHNFAAVDVNTGEATPLDVPVTGALVSRVYALAAVGSTVYLGGVFHSVGGVTRTALAAIDATSGAVLPWAPAIGCSSGSGCFLSVLRLATDGSSVFFAGEFETVNGEGRSGVAAVTTAGVLTPFAPEPAPFPFSSERRVWALVPAHGRVYIGGEFGSIQGGAKPYVAALDAATGSPLAWDPRVDGPVTGIAPTSDRVFIAGRFGRVGGQFQPMLASVDTITGTFDFAFRPEVSTVVDAVAVAGPQVVVAAAGGRVNGRDVQGVVGLDRSSGALSIPTGAEAIATWGLLASPDGWLGVAAATSNHLSGYLSFTANATAGGDSPAPPAPPPPGGGGGGGGGAGPDVEVSVAVSNPTPSPNATVDVLVAVRNRSTSVAARGLRAVITLPSGATLLAPPTYETGNGCVGTTLLDCNLDFLSPNATSTLRFAINVGAAGTKRLTASASMTVADPNLANNAAALTLTVAAPRPLLPPAVTPRAPAVKTFTGNGRANTLYGTAGRDILRGLGGNDRLFARGGDDSVFGGAGNDRLVGGAGRDKLDGGLGADLIDARDGSRDSIVCGPGRDAVVADRRDAVGRSCEAVRRR